MSVKVAVITLGCRVNQYESDAIMQEFLKKGATVCNSEEICDIYVINTCSVTSESDRKSKQLIRRCVGKNKDAVIIVTGCFSQINPTVAASIPGVDFVCGNNSKSMIPEKAYELLNSKKSTEIVMPSIYNGKFDSLHVGAPLTRTRAFVKIEDGCESKCAYCIIPFARGSVRSEKPEFIIEEAKKIASQGCPEIVLTGIETSSYGKDFDYNYSLPDLIKDISEIDGIQRIRLGSVDPAYITPSFVDRVKNIGKLMPHYHISMQSGSSAVLKMMRRKYNIQQATENIEYLKESIPNLMLTADVITGFPGETEEYFNQTLDFFRKERFLHIHIFPYSKRKGTYAYSMPDQVDERIKKERLHMLENMQKEIKSDILKSQIADRKEAKVLFENSENGFFFGHSDNFIEVKVKTNENLNSLIKDVTYISEDGNCLIGEIK